ncbi:MAG: outer membrane beta-barrel protein [Bacteroidota bacterium]
MKKLLLVFAASFLLFQISDAQLIKFGIKGGVGFSKLAIEDITGLTDGTEVYNLVTGESVTGYHVGVNARIKLAMVFIQPEVYFNAGGGTLQKVVDGGTSELVNVDFSRLDIPVLVGVKLGPARLGVGPVGSLVLQDSYNDLLTLIDNPDFELFSSKMTWGFQAGVGLDIWKLSIDARYEGSLSTLGKEQITVGTTNFALDARPSQWLVSLGFWF